jgi:tRNA(Leu) C34 or U34 (ribose-2'-O)-methylase TrmL
VFIEQVKGARNIVNVCHPQIACYVLGSEDNGIPEAMMIGYQKVFIDTPICLNVAVAGSIIMYDRKSKEK